MKIGILTEIVNFHSGSRAPLEIARHLALLDNDVTVYAYPDKLDPKAKNALQKDKVKIKLIKKSKNKFLAKQLAAVSLFKMLRADKPQITTFSGTPPFFIAAKLTGIPIVRIYQGVQFDALLENLLPDQKLTFGQKILNRIANAAIFLIDFMSFRLSTAIVSISKYASAEGKKLYSRKSDAVIYHGTTYMKIPKQVQKKDNKTVNIISVSRITPYKGFHKIIDALLKVKTKKKIKLTIVGSQPKKEYVKYLLKKGKEKVEIVTDPTDWELAKIYQKSDIYVCADRYLYFGLPICEAGAFSLPTVSLNLAAAKEIIKDKQSGLIANSQEELTLNLQLLIKNPALRIKMGKQAKALAFSEFTWQKAAKQYQNLFINLLKKH